MLYFHFLIRIHTCQLYVGFQSKQEFKLRQIILCISLAAAAFAPAAHSEIFGVIKTADETVVLSDKRGPCPLEFNLGFRMTSKGGKPYGEGGCYRIEQDRFVAIRFFIDGANAPARRYSLDDFILSDYYRSMNPLAN